MEGTDRFLVWNGKFR